MHNILYINSHSIYYAKYAIAEHDSYNVQYLLVTFFKIP